MATIRYEAANLCVDQENDMSSSNQLSKPSNISQQIPKRRALSTLPNVRVQPTRGAKPRTATFAGCDENVSCENSENRSSVLDSKNVQPTSHFVVYDERKKEMDMSYHEHDSSASSLPECVLQIPHRTALATLSQLTNISESFRDIQPDSPMVLDTSEEACSESISNVQFLRSDYEQDVYNYLKDVELKFRPKPHYMKKQPDITLSMRSILVDWLVEVGEEYKLQTETLYLSVNYIDRFLSSMSVVRSKLQLVGTASMFIAAKYEEIYPPDLGEFVYITDDTYSKKQVLRMEHLILKVLSFDLAIPTAYSFLQRFCSVGRTTEVAQFLAQYICELSLLESEPYLLFLPSHIAAASLMLANHTVGLNPWNEELEAYTGFNVKNFQECIRCLHRSFTNASSFPQQAVYDKYKSAKYRSVSLIAPPAAAPW